MPLHDVTAPFGTAVVDELQFTVPTLEFYLVDRFLVTAVHGPSSLAAMLAGSA